MSSSCRKLFLLLPAAALLGQPRALDLQAAASLDAQGKCAESAPIYQRALASGPPSPALLNNAGNHHLACGEPSKASALFERLVQRIPAHANANLQLARMAVDRNDRPAAMASIRVLQASANADDNAAAGALYARLGEFALARRAWQAVVSKRPDDFDALWNFGRVAARAGDGAAARQALEAARQLQPAHIGVLRELGLAHATAGDFPRAVFLLAQARQNAPADAAIALALARAAEDAGFHGDAANAYAHYLTLRPDDSAARRDRARALANTPSHQEEGLAALREYVAQNPADSIGHLQLAQLIWSTDADGSLAHLAEALQIDPRLTAAHTARAWLLHRLGRDPEALPHIEAALAREPADVRSLDLHGLVLQSMDRVSDAERAFRKAVALAPADWESRQHLGRVLMEQGRPNEARRWLDEAQALRPARQRDARREPGMIELATLPEPVRLARETARFQSMVRARPDDAALRMHLGSLLLAASRESDAEAEFRQLAKMPADNQTLAQASRALHQAGRHEWALPLLRRLPPATAVDELSRAAAAAPDDRAVALALAVATALNGQRAGAEALCARLRQRWPDWAPARLIQPLIQGQPKLASQTCRTLKEWMAPACLGGHP